MALIRAQTAFLVASCLASQATVLPQNIASSITSTESVARSIVTDHITQTHHTLVTDTPRANSAETPLAKIEIDININGLVGQNASPDDSRVGGLAAPAPGAKATAPLRDDNYPPFPASPVLPIASKSTYPPASPFTTAPSNEPPTVAAAGAYPGSLLVTLQPAIHWDCDVDDMENLRPDESHSVYYNPDGGVAVADARHQYAWVRSNHSYPTVVLEHSAYIQETTCQADGLLISFTTLEAVKFCQKTWPSQIILATYTTQCTGTKADTGVQVYFLTSSIVFNGLEATVVAIQVTIQEAVTDIDLSWAAAGLRGGGGGGGSPSGPNTGNFTHPDGGCGTPPAPTINGFPAAPCGPGFDDALDKMLGFVPFTEVDFPSSLKDVAPGITDTNPNDYDEIDLEDTNGMINRRVLRKRWNPFKRIAQAVARGVKGAVKTATNAVKQAATAVVDGAKKVANVVADAVSSLANPKVDKTFPVDLGPKKLVDSPFGPAFQLYKKEKENKGGTASGAIGLYCVDCKVKGKIHVGGQLSFSLLGGGLTKGQLGLDGNIEAGLFLGLAAEARYSREFKTPIASVGIPGLTIPNIVTVGPVLKLDAALDIAIAAEGKILAGTQMTIDKFGASLDIVSGKSSASFKPVFKNRFEASGEVSAEAGLGLPITVGVGLDIPVIKFSKLVAVIDKPSIRFSAKYAFSTTDATLPCNNGVSYSVNLANDLTYDLFGVKQGDIWKYKSDNLVSGCKQLGNSPARGRSTNSADRTSTPTSNKAASTPTLSAVETPAVSIEQFTTTSKPSSTPTTSLADATDDTEGERIVARRQATASPVVSDLTLDDGYASGTTNYNESDYLSDADYNAMLKQAKAANEDKVNTDGSVYVQLRDETGQYLLSADESGIFDLVPANAADADTTLVSYDNVTTEDVEGRLFHYFPETMKAFGVSRFRLAGTENWPRTADIVALAPVNFDDSADTPGLYVASDTQGGFYYTVVCKIQGRPSKVFLVDDPSEERLGSLKTRKELQWTVIGGVVEECFPIAFMSKGPGL